MNTGGMHSSKTNDVLVVGELNVDLIFNQINKFPQVGKEVLAENFTLTLGSSSAIFASNLCTLGSRVSFVGKLGFDDFGNYIFSALQSKGVNTLSIARTTQHSTGVTIALNFNEDRAMVTYPGAMAHLCIEDIAEADLLKSRHLHVSSIFLQPELKADIINLFAKAKAFGLTTSLDPQWDPSEQWDLDLEELLPHVDIFMPNINEVQALTDVEDLHKAAHAIKSFCNVLVVKHGNTGASLWTKEEFYHQHPFTNTQVVDSIGAGDSFNAGFIHKFIQQKSLKECLEFAALTGAINTTRQGGTTAFENIELVRSIAASCFNYEI